MSHVVSNRFRFYRGLTGPLLLAIAVLRGTFFCYAYEYLHYVPYGMTRLSLGQARQAPQVGSRVDFRIISMSIQSGRFPLRTFFVRA
jgi:hypothetical protein